MATLYALGWYTRCFVTFLVGLTMLVDSTSILSKRMDIVACADAPSPLPAAAKLKKNPFYENRFYALFRRLKSFVAFLKVRPSAPLLSGSMIVLDGGRRL